MNNKILASIAIIFVGMAFGIVATIVFATRGKSAYWIDKKLKIGSVLLSLTAILGSTTGCGGCQPTCYDTAKPEPEIMCYDVPYEPYTIEINQVINTTNLEISGKINGETNGNFSYTLSLEDDTIQNASLKVDTSGNFQIKTDKKLKGGDYSLIISETEKNYLQEIRISVKE